MSDQVTPRYVVVFHHPSLSLPPVTHSTGKTAAEHHGIRRVMFYSDELLSRHSVISTHGFCTNTSSESDGDSLNTRADAVQCNKAHTGRRCTQLTAVLGSARHCLEFPDVSPVSTLTTLSHVTLYNALNKVDLKKFFIMPKSKRRSGN